MKEIETQKLAVQKASHEVDFYRSKLQEAIDEYNFQKSILDGYEDIKKIIESKTYAPKNPHDLYDEERDYKLSNQQSIYG